jgi:ABC-2 type transport system ATP-binding protein
MFRQMRGRDVLRFFAAIRPGGDYARGLELAERFELDISRRVAFMSTGMRQKLALAATLSADTPLVILDEPTANLDPTVRATILELVGESRDAGRTVIFSSHVLAEVEEVCDRVVILRHGQVAHVQSMAELRRQHRVCLEPTGGIVELPANLKSQLTIVSNGDSQMVVDVAGSLSPVLEWLATLSLKDVTVESVGLRPIYDRFHARA